MNEIKIFTSEQFGQIRAVKVDGKPMFVASDIAKVLGYVKPNNAINDNCKHVTRVAGIMDAMGRPQEMAIIPETDIYRLVMRSKLPQAELFQDWVCEEVLPSIRKHGAYMTGETLAQMLQSPDNLIELLTVLKSEQDRNAALSIQNEINARNIEAMKPKAAYYDTVLQSDTLIPTEIIAAQLGISAIKLNKFLCEYKIQRKVGGVYVLCADMRGKGYEGYKTYCYSDSNTGKVKTKQHMYWTENGAKMIIKLHVWDNSKLLN